MDPQLPDIVTLVVRHRVRTQQLPSYESWLRRVMDVASQFEGHLGVDVIRSRHKGLAQFTVVLRFTCIARLQVWLNSIERKQLIEEALPLLADGDETEVSTVNEFWFTPDEQEGRPPRWKQACVTFLVILPLSLFVPIAWSPIFTAFPPLSGRLAGNVLITATIVLLVVYVFMPLVTSWFATWLEGDDDGATTR